AFCRDNDYAVRRTRSVKGSSISTFQHVYGRDIIRVQILNPTTEVNSTCRQACRTACHIGGRIVNRHTVDYIQRLVVTEGVIPTQNQPGTRTNRTTSACDLCARNPTRKVID